MRVSHEVAKRQQMQIRRIAAGADLPPSLDAPELEHKHGGRGEQSETLPDFLEEIS